MFDEENLISLATFLSFCLSVHNSYVHFLHYIFKKFSHFFAKFSHYFFAKFSHYFFTRFSHFLAKFSQFLFREHFALFCETDVSEKIRNFRERTRCAKCSQKQSFAKNAKSSKGSGFLTTRKSSNFI